MSGNKDVHGLSKETVSDIDAGENFEFRGGSPNLPKDGKYGHPCSLYGPPLFKVKRLCGGKVIMRFSNELYRPGA